MNPDLPVFESARVLVIGDVMLDRYWHGSTSRISPEAPVPVVRVEQTEERPGGAANVALNVVALGASANLIGVVGHDEPAAVLEQKLGSAGVDCHLLGVAGVPTITKLRVLSKHQQLIRLDFEDHLLDFDPAAMLAEFQRQLPRADVVVLSDYGKGTLRAAAQLIAMARAAGKPVLVDPKGTDFEPYRGATVVTPNYGEFEAVTGACADEAAFVAHAEVLRTRLELDALLVTRSERGMSLVCGADAVLDLPAQAREVFDVTGAGDTVNATLAAALAAGQDLEHATALANTAAGIVVGKLGTATVSLLELRRALREQHHHGRGVLDEAELVQAVADGRAHGERIVMTNGCFDILHAGHVEYLNHARRLGDRLIVAVNDDDSVRRLKGAARPINTLEQRMQVLSGLECVDWVVPFSEDTPQRLICAVLPDVLVKGGDYRPQDIAGGDCVRARGGEVIVLPYREGCSTSRIIEALSEHQRAAPQAVEGSGGKRK